MRGSFLFSCSFCFFFCLPAGRFPLWDYSLKLTDPAWVYINFQQPHGHKDGFLYLVKPESQSHLYSFPGKAAQPESRIKGKIVKGRLKVCGQNKCRENSCSVWKEMRGEKKEVAGRGREEGGKKRGKETDHVCFIIVLLWLCYLLACGFFLLSFFFKTKAMAVYLRFTPILTILEFQIMCAEVLLRFIS